MVGGSPVVNLVKHFMIVIYNSRVVCLGKCPYYHCRVVIYACKMFIRLATGLVVMGGDSCSKGHEFESQRQILDGHYFTLICCKNCIVWLKRPKITEKEAGVGPFFKKNDPMVDDDQANFIHSSRFYLLLLPSNSDQYWKTFYTD